MFGMQKKRYLYICLLVLAIGTHLLIFYRDHIFSSYFQPRQVGTVKTYTIKPVDGVNPTPTLRSQLPYSKAKLTEKSTSTSILAHSTLKSTSTLKPASRSIPNTLEPDISKSILNENNNNSTPTLKSQLLHSEATATENLKPNSRFTPVTSKLDVSKTMVNISNNVKLNQTSSKIYQRKCQDLTEIVLNRLDYLQNPANCSTAKKLICDVWGAGMGSVVHHWVCCLIYAYYTNRTMFIDLRQWPYLQGVTSKDGVKQFEDLFQSISKCKLTDYDNKTAVTWPKSKSQITYNHNISVIRILPIGIVLRDKLKLPKIFHFALPTKLFYRTIDFKYQPIAWWIGLLAKHIIRPNHNLQQFIDQSRKKFKFQSPIVGLHIRRTDKRTEAKLFNIDQYMVKVKAFFNRLAKQSIQIEKRVFVITDEPWLINQLIKKYPDYHYVHPPIKQLTAGTFTSRYSAIHLKYFIRDLFLLAECDYLVVTMSSNVGRLAYELHEVIYSQTKSKHYTSLDDDYFIQGLYRNLQAPQIMRANQDCRSNISNGISIIKGDLLDSCISSNHSKTMYYGYSKRLKKSGYFLRSCVTYLVDNEVYPDYSEVDKTLHRDETDRYQANSEDNTCTKSSIIDRIY